MQTNHPHNNRPIEPLEQRRLLASFEVVDRALLVTGTAEDDVVRYFIRQTNDVVFLAGGGVNSGGTATGQGPFLIISGTSGGVGTGNAVAMSDFDRIVVNLAEGNDSFLDDSESSLA